MRKLFFTVILLTGLCSMAQVTFDLGLRSGVNFSRFTQNDNENEKYNTITNFYVGGFSSFNFTKFYTLQPELTFSKQGTEREYLVFDNTLNKDVLYKETIKINYLSLGIINKFKFNAFNVHVGPSFDVKINNKDKELSTNGQTYYYNNDYDEILGIDFAFNLGLGYNITKNFGIEARIKKGILPVDDNWDSTNIVYQAGAYFTFPLKK